MIDSKVICFFIIKDVMGQSFIREFAAFFKVQS